MNKALRAMYELGQRACGVSVGEACKAVGSSSEIASARLRWMVRTGRAEQRPAREGRTQHRYFCRADETFDQMERRIAQETDVRREKRLKAANARLGGSPKPKDVRKAGGRPVIIVAPPARDRYQVDKVPRYFSALAIGSYPLREDTWATRITGGVRQ